MNARSAAVLISITVFHFNRCDISTTVLSFFFFSTNVIVLISRGEDRYFEYSVELFSGCATFTKQTKNLQNILIALNTIPKISKSFHSCILSFHQAKASQVPRKQRYFLHHMGRSEGFRYEARNSPNIADKYKKKII